MLYSNFNIYLRHVIPQNPSNPTPQRIPKKHINTKNHPLYPPMIPSLKSKSISWPKLFI